MLIIYTKAKHAAGDVIYAEIIAVTENILGEFGNNIPHITNISIRVILYNVVINNGEFELNDATILPDKKDK